MFPAKLLDEVSDERMNATDAETDGAASSTTDGAELDEDDDNSDLDPLTEDDRYALRHALVNPLDMFAEPFSIKVARILRGCMEYNSHQRSNSEGPKKLRSLCVRCRDEKDGDLEMLMHADVAEVVTFLPSEI